MSLRMNTVSGNESRVPQAKPGEATIVERYGKERAIVLHPEDYHRLCELERLFDEAVPLEPVELSEEAIRAHREEGTAGKAVTDPAVLAELFG